MGCARGPLPDSAQGAELGHCLVRVLEPQLLGGARGTFACESRVETKGRAVGGGRFVGARGSAVREFSSCGSSCSSVTLKPRGGPLRIEDGGGRAGDEAFIAELASAYATHLRGGRSPSRPAHVRRRCRFRRRHQLKAGHGDGASSSTPISSTTATPTDGEAREIGPVRGQRAASPARRGASSAPAKSPFRCADCGNCLRSP